MLLLLMLCKWQLVGRWLFVLVFVWLLLWLWGWVFVGLGGRRRLWRRLRRLLGVGGAVGVGGGFQRCEAVGLRVCAREGVRE